MRCQRILPGDRTSFRFTEKRTTIVSENWALGTPPTAKDRTSQKGRNALKKLLQDLPKFPQRKGLPTKSAVLVRAGARIADLEDTTGLRQLSFSRRLRPRLQAPGILVSLPICSSSSEVATSPAPHEVHPARAWQAKRSVMQQEVQQALTISYPSRPGAG